MPTQTVEITVDVSEGYELTGEYRVPLKDDWFLDIASSDAIRANNPWAEKRLILRKLPDPEPEVPVIDLGPHIADGWVATDMGGDVYWYSSRPECSDGLWLGGHDSNIGHLSIAAELRTLPPAESLRRVIHKEST